MKKVFKNPVVTFILGALIFSSISVYAAHKYAASNITYKDTTLDQALNTLYTKTNTYKNLTETTDVSSSNLLNGVKAYTSNGTLVTGSIPIITAENRTLTSGENYTIPQGYHDGTGTVKAPNSVKTGSFKTSTTSATNVNLGYQPRNVVIQGLTSNGYKFGINIGTDLYKLGWCTDGWIDSNPVYVSITSTGFRFVKVDPSDNVGNITLYYWAW